MNPESYLHFASENNTKLWFRSACLSRINIIPFLCYEPSFRHSTSKDASTIHPDITDLASYNIQQLYHIQRLNHLYNIQPLNHIKQTDPRRQNTTA